MGRAAHLARLLGKRFPSDLDEETITDYVRTRLKEGVGHRTCNLEVSVLANALGGKRSSFWPRLKRLEPDDVGKAIPVDEQALILAAARNQSPLHLHVPDDAV